jgi:hypothetical protein
MEQFKVGETVCDVDPSVAGGKPLVAAMLTEYFITTTATKSSRSTTATMRWQRSSVGGLT